MVALGNGLGVEIETGVLSDLRNASSAGEKLAILAAAADRGSFALTDEDGVSIRTECVKPFMDGN